MADTQVTRAYAFIEDAYNRLKENVPNFNFRMEQVELSKAIALNYIEKTPLAAEAPTGTGKTLAYLVGGLAAARQLNSAAGAKPLVISTGTKALQSQLMSNDLPKLEMAGLITMKEAALAKGKSNFFCAQMAEDAVVQQELRLADEIPEYMRDDMEAGEERMLAPEDIEPLFEAFDSKVWDGDFDNYQGVLPKPLDRIRVNSETCLKKKCPRYSECPYFQMKSRMENASVIVANHDLVMLDLLLVSQEIEPTIPVDNYLVVFDEAHQLPDKALKVGSSEANLASLRIALDKLRFFKKTVWQSLDLINLMDAKSLHQNFFDATPLLIPISDLFRAFQGFNVDEETMTKRFPKGVVPEQLLGLIERAHAPLQTLYVRLSTALGAIQQLGQQDGNQSRQDISEALYKGTQLSRTINEALIGLEKFKDAKDVVKWAYITEARVSLHTSPLEGSAVLKPLLWDAPRAQAVLMSATLRDLSGFKRFGHKAGLPGKTRTVVMPYTFPYKESTLTVAYMNATPKAAERKQYLAELAEKVPLYIAEGEATLLLFPSRTMLKALTPLLRARLGETNVLVQGELPIKQLLSMHVARVDAGKTSILCGLATMAEGLDLPGHYCEHVGILALPFAVPSDPVEEEISEILGSKYFAERSLPDAAVRLMQMVGRLLRRESDRGRVTIFDRRMATMSYGIKLLNFLPPFRKIIEKDTAEA